MLLPANIRKCAEVDDLSTIFWSYSSYGVIATVCPSTDLQNVADILLFRPLMG